MLTFGKTCRHIVLADEGTVILRRQSQPWSPGLPSTVCPLFRSFANDHRQTMARLPQCDGRENVQFVSRYGGQAEPLSHRGQNQHGLHHFEIVADSDARTFAKGKIGNKAGSLRIRSLSQRSGRNSSGFSYHLCRGARPIARTRPALLWECGNPSTRNRTSLAGQCWEPAGRSAWTLNDQSV